MRRCLRSELPLLVMAVYLPRIQILVVGGWVAIPNRSGRGSGAGALLPTTKGSEVKGSTAAMAHQWAKLIPKSRFVPIFEQFHRHARTCCGHPRLKNRVKTKTWMAGTSV